MVLRGFIQLSGRSDRFLLCNQVALGAIAQTGGIVGKILFGGGVAQIRGSIAGQCFSRNKGGSYCRNRVAPINPATTRQQAVRDGLSYFAKNWAAGLTQTQRDAWIQFALLFPITDVFGAQLQLSGQQMYVRLNQIILDAGGTAIDDAPVDQDVGALDTVSGEIDLASGGTFELTYTPTPIGTLDKVQIWATPPLSPGISYVKNKLRLLQTSALNAASPADFQAAYEVLFGTPAVGLKVVLYSRVVRVSNGATSQALRDDVIVVDST